MKRKLTCILLAALLLLGLCGSAFAETPAATEPQLLNVTDTVGLLTSEEDWALEEKAEEISERYGVGIYLLIIEDYSVYYDDVYEAAWQFYHMFTLGEGEDRDGVILMMSMSNRKYATFFYGPKAEYAFDSYGQEKMEEKFLDEFREDDWYDGFENYIEVCGEYLAKAEAGEPVREGWTDGEDGSAPALSVGVVLIFAAVSCVIALIVCLILKGRMKTVRKGAHADAYVAGGLDLTDSRDQFTHITETRTKIERESSSGGSSGHEGGGGSGRSGSF